MLDTHARKYVEPIIDFGAKFFEKLGFTPNQVTLIAFIIGIVSGPIIYFGYDLIGILFLWISGYLDAVDGALARKLNKTSEFGTVMDIVFDRLVEISLIISLSFLDLNYMWAYLILSCSIIVSMTIFLTVGAVSKKSGKKSFYYQAGLGERTEGFILFTLIVLIHQFRLELILIFASVVLFTACQRMLEAKKILK